MGQGTRQWKALMRKNYINWKRQAKCSFCELCCPAVVMFLMVILRNVIEVETLDFSSLVSVRQPTFPAFDYNGNSWSFTKLSQTSAEMEDFFKYANYPGDHYYVNISDTYHMTKDATSPLYMVPSDCLKVKSFQLPKVASTIIAVIGEEDNLNQPTEMMVEYLKTLREAQQISTPRINAVLQELYGSDAELPFFRFQYFDSKDDLFAYTSAENYTFPGGNEAVCYGFQFNHTDDGWNLELYFNDQQQMGGGQSIGIPNTQNPAYNPLQTTPDTSGFVDYLTRGYSTLHNLAANIALMTEADSNEARITLLSAPMPASQSETDPFTDVLTGVLPFLLLLIFIPPVYNTVFMLVREKESRIKESMRMMGMKDLAYWLSWYTHYTCVSTAIVFLAWLVLLINCMDHSNSFLVLVLMIFYAQAIFGQIIFLSSLFENSKYSGLVGTLIYFGFNLVGIPVQQPTSAKGAKIGLSLIPQVGMQQTVAVFGNLEGSGLGLTFGTAGKDINNYSYGIGILMFVISFFVFALLGFYLDAVLPRTYGEKMPACFCCTKKFCCRCCMKEEEGFEDVLDNDELQRRETLRNTAGSRSTEGKITDKFETKYLVNKDNYEPVPPEVARMELENQFLKISDLKKTYPNGFQAVNGINLKMYNGQIFALLGHNGAGKSTTISMMTGLLSKSQGAGRIFGDDLFNEMDKVRRYLGVCPQHDVLFDLLTPEEHLDIFYDFKGGDPAGKDEEIRGLIVDVGVAPDKKKQAGSLSGGNRRKLSVAIALCGNSRIVMLDEPTAGMDLSARRGLWDMLKNYRNNRIIILTTHYMDEADVLGDRIGIMAKGKIVCLGTSLFLKNRYGAGYKLTMVKKFKRPNKKIQPYLEQVFGPVEKLSEVSQEITFKIDFDQASQFASFFQQFDNDMDQQDILSYGISMTTLEEVFIKANGDDEPIDEQPKIMAEKDQKFDQLIDEANKDPTGDRSRGSSVNREGASLRGTNVSGNRKIADDFDGGALDEPNEAMSSENLVGNGSLCESIQALIVKRFNIYKRDKCGLVCEVLVPIILVLIGLSLLQIPWIVDSPSFMLTTDAYPGPQRATFNDQNYVQTTDEWTPMQLAEGLPDYDNGYWTINYYEGSTDETTGASDYTYEQFYEYVNSTQLVGDSEPYRFGSFQIYKADTSNYDIQINMLVNATSQMSVPYFSQYMYESILKQVNPDVKFNVSTAPFPVFFVFESRVASGQALDFAIIVSIALALIPCVIISFIIKEREMQLKHMQLISGVSLPAYWLSNLISDIVKTYVPVIIILILTYAFQLEYDGVWELLIIYPVAIVPFTYITSFIFTGDTVAQIMTLFMHFLLGGILPLVVFVLQNIPTTADLGDSMRWWFTFVPTYCIGHGIVWSSTWELLNVSRNGLININNNKYNLTPINTNIYAFANLSGDYTMMLIMGVFCTLLLFFIEADIFQSCAKFSFYQVPQPRPDLDLDEDVLEEEERLSKQRLGRDVEFRDSSNAPLLDPENLSKSPSEMDVIRVYNFRKAYTTLFGKPFLAVERISFGLDYGECFALLGVNGAGKSTTFKSLTRDIVPTSGQISIAGYNVLEEFNEARKLIGYCPQHDAIFPLITVAEHLWFYAKIKGVPVAKREEVVEDAIVQLNLKEHRDKPAGTLSGGNKRKLSVGIAIVGNPPIILLDEPSAGMDPEARRFMWSVVEKISQRDKKSAVILTTHSMEEAEALSTKMGIMVRGGIFRCYGSSQHIKNKYATGYEVEIKIKKPSYADLEQFRDRLGLNGELSSRIDLAQAKEKLETSDIEGLIIDQIRKDGIGSDLVIEAGVNNGQVRMSALVQFCYTQDNGFKVIAELCRQFEQVELLEQCGDFYKLRVPREDKTIGYLFGEIESKKAAMNIQEYGVQQTSLEQIFQNFAQMSVDDKAAFTFKVNALDQLQLMNPDRKSTMLQKRMSVKGRKSTTSASRDNEKDAGYDLADVAKDSALLQPRS